MENITALLMATAAVIGAVFSIVQGYRNGKKTDKESRRIEDEITERVLRRANEDSKKLYIRVDELECEDKKNKELIEKQRLRIICLERDNREITHLRKRVRELENEDKENKELIEKQKLRIDELEKKAGTGPLKEAH